LELHDRDGSIFPQDDPQDLGGRMMDFVLLVFVGLKHMVLLCTCNTVVLLPQGEHLSF
jgi:hypothetical protein